MNLPNLIKLEDHGGSWEDYLEVVYAIFKRDFIDNKVSYKKRKIALKKYPLLKGKEACFWHLTTEGKIEEKRIPDLRKCEKIGWIKPIIESSGNKEIKFWISKRGREDRIFIQYIS